MKELVKCDICGKEFSTKGIGSHKWRVHGAGQDFVTGVTGKPSWSKGLTKESDSRIKKQSESLKKRAQSTFSDIRKQLQPKLDDDGKLYQRYANKRVNARQEGLECELSFDEYLQLVDRAGLVSSQLGFKGQGYVLARYNDEGNYTFNNCRFVTQQQNSDEKKITTKLIENGKIQGKRLNEYRAKVRLEDPELYQEWIDKSSKKRKEARKEHKEDCISLAKVVDKRNSQYGTFWITNGIENKKWRLEKGDLPKGFYKGRTML